MGAVPVTGVVAGDREVDAVDVQVAQVPPVPVAVVPPWIWRRPESLPHDDITPNGR